MCLINSFGCINTAFEKQNQNTISVMQLSFVYKGSSKLFFWEICKGDQSFLFFLAPAAFHYSEKLEALPLLALTRVDSLFLCFLRRTTSGHFPTPEP